MPELIIWKNQQFNKLRKEMEHMLDRLRGEFGLSSFPRTVGEFPDFDMAETEDNLLVKARVPDMDLDDISIKVSENSLIIKGEIREEATRHANGVVGTESRHSSFSRTLRLPCRIVVDDVKAGYKEGVISIEMPKCKRTKSRVMKVERY